MNAPISALSTASLTAVCPRRTNDPTSARLSIRDLSSMAYAVGHTHWVYVARPDRTGAAHRLNDLLAPGYFNDAAGMMAQGDMIDACAHDGGAILYVVEARSRPDRVRIAVMCRTGDV